MRAGSRTLLALAALALLTALIGVADHRNKAARMQRADVAWWYCQHEGKQCGRNAEAVEHRSGRIEKGWERRQLGYVLLLGIFVGGGLTVTATTLRPKTA